MPRCRVILLALALSALVAGCPPAPGEIPPVSVSLDTGATGGVLVCWSDDDLYTEAGSQVGTTGGQLLDPADVLYRIHRGPSGTPLALDIDDLVTEIYGDTAEMKATGASCASGFEFATEDTPPLAGTWVYAVCRIVNGETSGCSSEAETDWIPAATDASGDSGDGAATDSGATTDAGDSDAATDVGDSSAAGDSGAPCDGGPGGSC